MSITIAVDLMGSDTPPHDLFLGVLHACTDLPKEVRFLCFVTEAVLPHLAGSLGSYAERIAFQVVPEVIHMTDSPLLAIRRKKKSSLLAGIQAVKAKSVAAFVTPGNTGALLAASTLVLPLLPGIDRPALLAHLPTKQQTMAVLDVGGIVSVKADHLVQYARMGAAYQRCCLDVAKPKVGLLNIGTESKKGTEELRQAYEILRSTPSTSFEFVGNIEGRDAFDGKVDVIVTDGFAGNIFLKTSEGTSAFILEKLREQLSTYSEELRDQFSRIQGFFDYAEYRGATLCGVEGIVVKCHGYSSAKAMYHAIEGCYALTKQQFVSRIKSELKD